MPPQPYNPAQQGDDTSGIVFDYEPKDSSGSVEVDHESQTIDKRDSSEDLSDPNIAFDESSNDLPIGAPPRWTWAFTQLRKLVTEAKGAATDEVVKFVMKHLSGTKLIFVVGKTGTGKTTILSELTGLAELEAGKTLKAGTKEYHVCPAIIDDEQYLFIDTAGFGDPYCDDVEIFRNTVSCLMAFGPFVQVVGVLFVIGNPGTRLDRQDAKTLRGLQCFCGPGFYRNITFVTSFWDSYNAASFRQALARTQSLYEDEILAQVLHPSDSYKRYHGAHIYHHGVTGGKLTSDSFPVLSIGECTAELRNLIRLRYAQLGYKPVKLQFMQEVENKVPFLETEAAKVLRAPAVGVTVNIVKGKCIIQATTHSPETPPLKFEKVPDIKSATWSETILQWYEVATKVANFYKDAHKKAYSASTAGGLWSSLRNWWMGSSR
ncbi:hypothetical protein ACHAPJ_010496 [Fusarium lateritium]